MKVLFPATHYYPVIGGIETWTQNIAERLSGKVEVFVVTGKVKNQPVKEIKNGVKIFRTSLFSLKNLSHSPLIYTLTVLPFIFLKCLSLIKSIRTSRTFQTSNIIIHCQGFLSSFLGYWLSVFTKVPYIVTVQRLESNLNPLKNFVYRKANFCIAASEAIKENFEKIGAKNIEVIPNGIDLERFTSSERKPHKDFVIITVARLERVKGIKYLIEAFKLFNRSLRSLVRDDNNSNISNNSNIKLVIIGDGSERKQLENLTEKLELKEKIKFLGEIPNERIPEYLAGADCFVLPSIKEGFGIAILEAQAVGLPVIATKMGGILDIIKDGETGILVEPKNSQALAQAIYKIYSGQKFAKANLEKYDWQNIVEKVYQIYQKICEF